MDAPGGVPPRVLKAVLDDGSYIDDELAAEYVGGVLASSRSEVSRDDRGVYWLSLVASMSTYQLRAHYVLYTITRQLLQGSGLNLGMETEAQAKGRIFVPFETLLPALAFGESERHEIPAILSHISWGLVAANLLGSHWAYGGDVKHLAPLAETPGLVFYPSALGAELYLALRPDQWVVERG